MLRSTISEAFRRRKASWDVGSQTSVVSQDLRSRGSVLLPFRCLIGTVPQAMAASPGPEIDWESSFSKLGDFLSSEEALSCPTGIVITGYVASTKAGVATTLQRCGI